MVDHNEVAWSYYKDLSVSLWHGNEMIGDGGVTEFIKSLESTLFQYNMREWFDMQKHIRTHAESLLRILKVARNCNPSQISNFDSITSFKRCFALFQT